ncbi:MAG: hypothetical protein JST59_19385 [Actinobacteria bacterium]|nr:hypothetical protein [Actinomycetota bacterium]
MIKRARIGRLSVLSILLVAVTAVTASATATAAAPAAKTPVVTTSGVGALRLGTAPAALRQKNLIGNLRKGCELEPGQRVAPLRAPLRGWATFAAHGHGLTGLTIEGGAETARHIAIGSTASEARTAYPHALYQAPGTADPFPQGFLWIPNLTHPKMTLIVEPGTRTVEAIAVPAPAFCE